MRRRVVIFDIGGVVADSPIVAIKQFCRRRGIGDLNHILGRSPTFDAFMRGVIPAPQFPAAMHAECTESGFAEGAALGVDGWQGVLALLEQGGLRPLMVQCVRRLREAGLTVAALTNNYDTGPPRSEAERVRQEEEHSNFVALFDHFIESRVVGLSKPDPKIYSLALQQIGCKASEAIFLDDIKVNLKAPAHMGIHTILVRNDTECSFHEALRELEDVSGVKLLDDTTVGELPVSRL